MFNVYEKIEKDRIDQIEDNYKETFKYILNNN